MDTDPLSHLEQLHRVQEPHLVTELEAADRLRLSVSYLRNMRVRGDGPAYVKLGRSVRYDPPDLMSWARSRQVTPTAACATAH
jgi:hypothetical protein